MSFYAELTDGKGMRVPIGAGIRLTIVPTGGATATYSLVSDDATGHDTDTDETTTVKKVIDVEAGHYYISSAGGTTKVWVV